MVVTAIGDAEVVSSNLTRRNHSFVLHTINSLSAMIRWAQDLDLLAITELTWVRKPVDDDFIRLSLRCFLRSLAL
jgi:hypothetical protein